MKASLNYLQLVGHEKRTKTTLLTTHEFSGLADSQPRKTSIVMVTQGKGETPTKQIYMSTRQIASPTKQKAQKSQILVKSNSNRTLKGSLKELESSSAIKEGEIYSKISPKVVFQDNKLNVFFIKELNTFTQPNAPKSVTQEAQNTIQEVPKAVVVIKKPPAGSPLRSNYKLTRFNRGALSNHKELLFTVMRKTERDSLNTSLKGSLNKLLKSYH